MISTPFLGNLLSSFLPSKKLLAVVLMVKNEAEVIIPTLEPWYQSGVRDFLVYDTGSTDSTVERVRAWFATRGLSSAQVIEEPFVDFATSRNRALDHTERLLDPTYFVVMPDAEWYGEQLDELIHFCTQKVVQPDGEPGYLMRIASDVYSFYTPRLFVRDAHVRFAGVVHESPVVVISQQVPGRCYFRWAPSARGAQKTNERFARDITLLLREHKERPHDPRTIFYLGQTYWTSGNYAESYRWYVARAAMQHGCPEERYLAHYLAGMMADLSGRPWQEAMQWYLSAYSLRPTRAEPLIRIAQHYYDVRDMDLCYLFARTAVDVPYPERDTSFIETQLYTHQRYALLSASAGIIGEYEVGIGATREGLKFSPCATDLLNNLAEFERRLKNGKPTWLPVDCC